MFRSFDDVTPESIFKQRRKFIHQLAYMAVIPTSVITNLAYGFKLESCSKLPDIFQGEQLTPEKSILNYNNYYEFTDNKEMVKHLVKALDITNWQVSIEGLVESPITLTINDILSMDITERIYRMRCVEGWSMVIPWQGVSLCHLLNLSKPLASAKYVKFVGLYDPELMIGQRNKSFNWPYTEGLRLDEALHPLTTIATGMYNKPLSKQNGAPIRLVVPWKYGYKSIKAITKIVLTDQQPITTWQQINHKEYGFYGNVNPNVPHPRWSQRKEVRLGEIKKRRTDMFNGYEDIVASLYKDDDINLLF